MCVEMQMIGVPRWRKLYLYSCALVVVRFVLLFFYLRIRGLFFHCTITSVFLFAKSLLLVPLNNSA